MFGQALFFGVTAAARTIQCLERDMVTFLGCIRAENARGWRDVSLENDPEGGVSQKNWLDHMAVK
jgi:hypothetical protein